jgi:hypothetical protein
MTFLEAAILAGVVTILLATLGIRRPQAIAFLLTVAIVYVAIGLIGSPVASIGRLALVLLSLTTVAGKLPVLEWLAPDKIRQNRKLKEIVGTVDSAHRAWSSAATADAGTRRAAREATSQACATALAKLDALQPSNPAWSEAFVAARAYVTALRAASSYPDARTESILQRDLDLDALSREMNRAWDRAQAQ